VPDFSFEFCEAKLAVTLELPSVADFFVAPVEVIAVHGSDFCMAGKNFNKFLVGA
jgi:hypothetical protein